MLVNYSTNTVSGDRVLITMMEVDTWPLARAVHKTVVKSGAHPHIEFKSTLLQRDLMISGDTEKLDISHELQEKGIRWANIYIGLRGASNPHEFHGIKPQRITAFRKSLGKVSALRTELTRWVIVRVPNTSFAQQAGMSTDEMMDFFFNATLLDWEKECTRYKEIQKILQSSEKVRIVSDNTD
ncbi:MAG: hypothetical protein CL935_04850 [Deltaproteobacteria bacterium]|nr:hypothetical protein [Deltaproteobacteria bacterium]